jgi:hypothetical protein
MQPSLLDCIAEPITTRLRQSDDQCFVHPLAWIQKQFMMAPYVRSDWRVGNCAQLVHDKSNNVEFRCRRFTSAARKIFFSVSAKTLYTKAYSLNEACYS